MMWDPLYFQVCSAGPNDADETATTEGAKSEYGGEAVEV